MIVVCSQSSSPYLLISTVFGMVSSLHPTSYFHDFYTCFTIYSAISMAKIQQATLYNAIARALSAGHAHWRGYTTAHTPYTQNGD